MIINFKADARQSTAQFTLKNMVIPDIVGYFSSLSGIFIFDPDNLSNSRIEASIDVKSIYSGSEIRDQLLKGEEFFDVLKYPQIQFLSKKIEIFDEDILKVIGELSVKNITKVVVLNVELPHDLRKKRINIAASILVNRDEFELELGSVLEVGEVLIGNNIQMTMDIELIKQ